MESLIERETLVKKILYKRLYGSMNPRDNVLYFNNNIDVRICPKNGMSTLKWVLWKSYGLSVDEHNAKARNCGTKNHRVDEILTKGYPMEYPYRKDSLRVAIVRDPVRRFLSAAEYIKSQWESNIDLIKQTQLDNFEQKRAYGKMSDLDDLPDDIDELIDKVINYEINNTHFWTQAYYLGPRGQYDKIFAMRDFRHFTDWLQEACDSPVTFERVKINIGNKEKRYYPSYSELTRKQKKLIMDIYREDYNYGWTEENATESF